MGDIMATESKEAQTKERSRQQQFKEILTRRMVIAPVTLIPWKIWSSPSRSSLNAFLSLFPLFDDTIPTRVALITEIITRSECPLICHKPCLGGNSLLALGRFSSSRKVISVVVVDPLSLRDIHLFYLSSCSVEAKQGATCNVGTGTTYYLLGE